MSTYRLETLSHWQPTPSLHQIRSQKLNILQDSKETQQKTGQMEPVLIVKLEHVPGTKMVISDTLSHRPDLCQEENDNDNMTLLPNTLFVGAIDLALKDLLATAGRNNSLTRHALQTLKEPATSTLADWMVEDGLMFYKGQCYVLDNLEVRRQVVS